MDVHALREGKQAKLVSIGSHLVENGWRAVDLFTDVGVQLGQALLEVAAIATQKKRTSDRTTRLKQRPSERRGLQGHCCLECPCAWNASTQ